MTENVTEDGLVKGGREYSGVNIQPKGSAALLSWGISLHLSHLAEYLDIEM